MKIISFFFLLMLIFSCKTKEEILTSKHGHYPTKLYDYSRSNSLDYSGIPITTSDRTPLTFSDEGAWFSFGLSDIDSIQGGFTGPYLMSQENGVWSSEMLSQLNIDEIIINSDLPKDTFTVKQNSYPSHLEQVYSNAYLTITQRLFFKSSSIALLTTTIENTSSRSLQIKPIWSGGLMNESLSILPISSGIQIQSSKSDAILFVETNADTVIVAPDGNSYSMSLEEITLPENDFIELNLSHTLYLSEQDQVLPFTFKSTSEDSISAIQQKMTSKKKELLKIYEQHLNSYKNETLFNLSTKAYLTLQNNWRAAAGELNHAGLFPSYNYEWFHGFWAWDSWKHAVALSKYDPILAQDQIRAMYDFQEENGFIPDCIYRDTTIEKHNYRNTKAPLSAWAVWNSQDGDFDREFLAEMYAKLVKQHEWWYENRDHDHDGLCEYGSTDGTLIAAKWESGMDNAVRFDSSAILKNKDGAYSLNQESVDLNAYLAAEKYYLSTIATSLFRDDCEKYKAEFESLKLKIQNQFFDKETGWFYDTNLDGTKFIKVMGCEGWIPLWANVASQEQAEAVKKNMMDPTKFNLDLPFQTLSADHPKFKPNRGYWRGPIWLDQTYFGIVGLHHYGFENEALSSTQKLLVNCKGLLQPGPSIRENYNPVTGEGMEAHNFSWSAAHIIMLMTGQDL